MSNVSKFRRAEILQKLGCVRYPLPETLKLEAGLLV